MMNKTLRAAALLGASTLVLAGCAAGGDGGDGTADGDGAEIRVWLVGADTPPAAREYLVETFEAENEGSTLVIEEQTWDGLVDKLTTSLSSSDSPDIVEFGNTQAPAFTSVGALLDITDMYDELGGDDLLPGFVEVGSYEGQFYAPPLYSGARVVFADPAFVSEAPATLDDFITTSKDLAAANAGKSGFYFAGQDWYNALPFIWENGGEVAVQGDDGTWDAQFSSPESLKGIAQVQQLMASSTAPKDGDEDKLWVPFREQKAATISAPSWAYWSIVADEDQAATALTDNLGYFALPGKDGGAAQVFAGGSNIAISAKSAHPTLAKSALSIIESPGYQEILAGAGLVPALTSLGDKTAGATPELAAIIAEAAATAKLTPASPKWADVEAARVLQDFFVQLANGGDAKSLATELDTKIEDILNG